MCSYNAVDYIALAIQSVFDQTYEDWELIISDDMSTDGTREWLQQNLSNNPKVRLFFQEKNLGYVENYCCPVKVSQKDIRLENSAYSGQNV
jgi:glycosyltransferase involved in cell wall biosynthesis